MTWGHFPEVLWFKDMAITKVILLAFLKIITFAKLQGHLQIPQNFENALEEISWWHQQTLYPWINLIKPPKVIESHLEK